MANQLDLLREEFPELYYNIGFECGPGWYYLLHDLSLAIREHLEKSPQCFPDEDGSRFYPTQIKEKYGGLRYYVGVGCEEIFSLIHAAEALSFEICENCGEDGYTRDLGWIYTRCDRCFEKLIGNLNK